MTEPEIKLQTTHERNLANTAITSISLPEPPYTRVVGDEVISCEKALESLATTSHYREELPQRIGHFENELQPLRELGYTGLMSLVRSPQPLTYEQAFSLITYVCMGTNNALFDNLAPKIEGTIPDPQRIRMRAMSLLQGMSVREGLLGLHPEEIAGMIAGVVELDTITRIGTGEDHIFAISGMGGDRGLQRPNGGDSKLFSTSTIAALTLGEFGKVHKHHSYPNTSKVGGQSAIEAFGARSDFMTAQEVEELIASSNIAMTDCNAMKTIHYFSHTIRGETINHAIGPGAFPHDRDETLHALIGVNQSVHPETFIQALQILHRKGIQAYGSSVAFCTVEQARTHIPEALLNPQSYYMDQSLNQLIALDEVAPPPYTTMAAFLVNGEDRGTYLIDATDFMDAQLVEGMIQDGLLIPNEEMCQADPTGQFDFHSHQATVAEIRRLHAAGKKIVALTDSPEQLSRTTLQAIGLDPDKDFDLYLPFTPEQGPLKMTQRATIFSQIAEYLHVIPERVLSVGDSYRSEIEPVQTLGMKTCLISNQPREGYTGALTSSFADANRAFYHAYRQKNT